MIFIQQVHDNIFEFDDCGKLSELFLYLSSRKEVVIFEIIRDDIIFIKFK